MVKIACMVPNGILIRLSKPGFDDGTGDGVKMIAHDGPAIRLSGPSSLHTGVGATHRDDLEPGVTEIDDAWWAKWLSQNENNTLVTLGMVKVLPEEPTGPNPPA